MSIGPHGIIPTAPALRWAEHSSIVKQAFGVNALVAAKAANPNILTVCRPIWMLRTDSGVDAAFDIIEFYRLHEGFVPDLTELWNESDEVGQNLGSGLERRLELHQEAVPVLHAAGIKVAGFSFSEGQPQLDDVEYLVAHDWAGVDALALHEYWFEAPPAGFDTWHALRYRRIKEWAGATCPQIIITECGRHI